MKPYVGKIYYKNEKGKVKHIVIKKLFLSDLLPVCQEYETRYNYQYTIQREGSSEIIRRSRASSYWNKKKEPEEKQMEIF